MKIIKITMLGFVILACFAPQQSQCMNLKTLATISAGISLGVIIGYMVCDSLTLDDEQDEKMITLETILSAYNTNSSSQGLDLFEESYNPKDSEITGIYSFKETFTAQEYAQEIKRLLEHEKHYLFCLTELLRIVREKKLTKAVLAHTFANEANEQQTLLELSKNTWAEDVVEQQRLNTLVYTHYAHFMRKFLETN